MCMHLKTNTFFPLGAYFHCEGGKKTAKCMYALLRRIIKYINVFFLECYLPFEMFYRL